MTNSQFLALPPTPLPAPSPALFRLQHLSLSDTYRFESPDPMQCSRSDCGSRLQDGMGSRDGGGGRITGREEDLACGKALLSPCSAPDNGFSRASECPVIQAEMLTSPPDVRWGNQGPLDFPSERSFAGKEYLNLYQMGWNDEILSSLGCVYHLCGRINLWASWKSLTLQGNRSRKGGRGRG